MEPTKANLEQELRATVRRSLEKAITFETPRTRLIYKNISPESIRDPAFLNPLRDGMRNKGWLEVEINSLFNISDAAPSRG